MTNKEFGEFLAEEMWKSRITKCPFVLNTEQAEALQNRWKELSKIKENNTMETINHEYYVSSEIANLLKEAGFDWKVNHYYFLQNDKIEVKSDFKHPAQNYNAPMATMDSKSFEFEVCSCPTLDVAQRWFREVKDIDIMVRIDYHYGEHYSKAYYCTFYIGDELYTTEHFNTYEEAQEAGIKKAFEIILKKDEQ